MDKGKMISMMVDRYEQFVLPESILLELINLGDRCVEAKQKQFDMEGAKNIPFTWEDRKFDLAFEPDMAEIIYGTRNILENLTKEERFNVFCVMEIGRWIDYKRGFDIDAVINFINWADEWYVEKKQTDFKTDYLWGKTTLSKWLRAGWEIIGPEYKRRRSLKLQKATILRKLEPLPYIIGHIAVIDEVENKAERKGAAQGAGGKKSNLRLLRDPGIVLTLEYKGITGTVEFSKRDYVYHGAIKGGVNGDSLYEGQTLELLIDAFRGAAQKALKE